MADDVSAAELLRQIGVSPEVSAAYDIMTDDGVPPEQAAELAVTSGRLWSDGATSRSPEQFARHFVKLRKHMRTL